MREIAPAQKVIADDIERPGISVTQAIDSLSMQAEGGENLEFVNVDYKNSVHNERGMALKKGDDRAVMEYFHKMQLEDSSFFYSIQFDDDNQIMKIFWADARSIVDYGHIGDVCFDTTKCLSRILLLYFNTSIDHSWSIWFGLERLWRK